jgi:hypothetical protein
MKRLIFPIQTLENLVTLTKDSSMLLRSLIEYDVNINEPLEINRFHNKSNCLLTGTDYRQGKNTSTNAVFTNKKLDKFFIDPNRRPDGRPLSENKYYDH